MHLERKHQMCCRPSFRCVSIINQFPRYSPAYIFIHLEEGFLKKGHRKDRRQCTHSTTPKPLRHTPPSIFNTFKAMDRPATRSKDSRLLRLPCLRHSSSSLPLHRQHSSLPRRLQQRRRLPRQHRSLSRTSRGTTAGLHGRRARRSCLARSAARAPSASVCLHVATARTRSPSVKQRK